MREKTKRSSSIESLSKMGRGFVLFLLVNIISIIGVGRASANGGIPPINPLHMFSVFVFFTFIINLPINGVAYILLLFGVLYHKKAPNAFRNSPKLFVSTLIFVVLVATIWGALIDGFMMVSTLISVNYSLSPFIFIFIALFLIFVSFFVLSIFLQKLDIKDAGLIGLGMVMLNIIFWSIIFLGGVFIAVGVNTILMAYIGLFIVIPIFAAWYKERHKTVKLRSLATYRPPINEEVVVVSGMCVIIIVALLFLVPILAPPALPTPRGTPMIALSQYSTEVDDHYVHLTWTISSPSRADIKWNDIGYILLLNGMRLTEGTQYVKNMSTERYVSGGQTIAIHIIKSTSNISIGDTVKLVLVFKPSGGTIGESTATVPTIK